MTKRSSYDIQKKILWFVKEKPSTYAQLERKINTGFKTIKANCEQLEDLGNLDIDELAKHESNGKPYHVVKITSQGIESLKRMKK